MTQLAGVVGVIVAAGSLTLPAAAATEPPLALRPVVTSLDAPIAVAHAGDTSRRLFVAQRDGRIYVVPRNRKRGELFLDLRDRVLCCAQESGLLGLAFHPRYGENGLFFVNYTDSSGDSVITRLAVSDDPAKADRDSAIEILRIPQPGPFHNSAHLAFGPDGYLYIGVGDGASDGDRENNGQNLESLLGKILRIDVDTASPYAIPDDNPFAGVAGARPEIWALGLRNPWRFSFDRLNGDLYIADVGQNEWEEINYQPAESGGGENYGWRLKEGDACYEPPENCDQEGLTAPLFAYPHDPEASGCSGSVVGGIRYRGPAEPVLSGLYVFADFCSQTLWGGRRNGAGNWRFEPLLDPGLRIVSFGEDERGRILVAAFGRRVYRLVGRPLFESSFDDPSLADWSRRKGKPRVGLGPGRQGSGLRLRLDGRVPRTFVRSFEPDGESYLRIAFDLDLERAGLGRKKLEILRLSGDRALLSLFLEQGPEGSAARLVAVEDDGTRRLVGRASLPQGRPAHLEVRWMRATGADRGDGEAVLLENGTIHATRSDLHNHDLVVDSVLLGLPSGSIRGQTGLLLIDNYTSSR